MKKSIIVFISLLFCSCTIFAKRTISEYYGVGLCNKPGYKCIRIKRSTTWEKQFPNERELNIVQKLNRTDTYLYRGRELVVPESFENLTINDISPFLLKIKPPKEKLIIINQNALAFGAYDAEGHLVYWGPISSGKDYCPDIGRSCRTITGIYYVFNKKGFSCRSNTFPVGRGGSHMPFCMFFYKGYAMHGSKEVYGFRDSHGCVRLFTRDAKWLNENFMDVIEKRGDMGTKIVIQRLKDQKK